MLNILHLRLSSVGRGCLMINKGFYNNFIWLITLLTLWLLIHTLMINGSPSYILLNVLLRGIIILAIKTKSLLLFYIFFEARVIPITIIIFMFGYQPEKIQASLFLLLYTVGGSLPLLIFLIFREIHLCSTTIAIPITIAFMVKTPIYRLHVWLPKAHVEAPVGGSMVLAGVLLKLGSYGLLLFISSIKLNALMTFYLRMCLVGSIVCSLVCIRQGDMKILIAYSSVVHMRVVNLGIVRGTEIGYRCGLMIAVGHGLCSPFLFLFAFLIYQYTHSRLLVNNSLACPLMMALLLGIISINIGMPPRIRLWSEVIAVIITLNLISWSWVAFLFIFLLRAAYNLYLYTSCIHTKFSYFNKAMRRKDIIPLLQMLFLGYCTFLSLDLFHICFMIISWHPPQYIPR